MNWIFRNLRVAAAGAAAAGVLAVSAAPALALSCRPLEATDAYLAAAKSESVYNIIAGEVQFDKARLPVSHAEDPNDTPPLTRIPARLTGKMLDGRYFSQRVNVPVVLEVECLGPWCAGIEPGSDYMFFAQQQGGALVIRVNACPGFVFPDTPQVRKQVIDCHRGKACVPALSR
ncbi:hypothetical protein AB838_20845 [Rhodobacteraceae bacterium (ex Bugula neritina AB1)]|nr:hypothetical protein AB838_20845 [Rhodobacteraceae bacterium (ex Bugula neritina AB1)]